MNRTQAERRHHYITSVDQIPDTFASEEEEWEFWETAEFADGVLEEGPHLEAEVDAILGITRAKRKRE